MSENGKKTSYGNTNKFWNDDLIKRGKEQITKLNFNEQLLCKKFTCFDSPN